MIFNTVTDPFCDPTTILTLTASFIHSGYPPSEILDTACKTMIGIPAEFIPCFYKVIITQPDSDIAIDRIFEQQLIQEPHS